MIRLFIKSSSLKSQLLPWNGLKPNEDARFFYGKV